MDLETGFNEEIPVLEIPETVTNEITEVDQVEIALLENLNHSLKTTNTLIMIIFVIFLGIVIYQLLWKFIKLFIN